MPRTKNIKQQKIQPVPEYLTDHDIYLFKQGTHVRLYDKLGSHLIQQYGVAGTWFAVWAPNAAHVFVIGEFNGWNKQSHPLALRNDDSGIWQGFIADVGHGAAYKYHIVSKHDGFQVDKGDPFAFYWQLSFGLPLALSFPSL